MTFPPKVWSGVLRRLQSELPSYSIEAWLLPLVPEAGDRDALRLRCPSTFHRDRVRDRFLGAIVSCLRDEVGDTASVELALAGEGEDLTAQAKGGTSSVPVAAALRAQAEAQRVAETRDADDSAGEPSTRANLRTHSPVTRSAGGGRTNQGGVSDRAAGRTADRGEAAKRPAPPVRRARPAARSARAPRSAELTFDNFVVGPCNSLAREASLALANEGRGLRQLYLNAPHGLGKTHLARAVVAEARRQDSARVIYAPAEAFLSEFMSSIQNKRTAGFQQRWRRECDVLVIEDIQFLVGKRATQLELYHTIQHVLDRGRRVLLTGDRPSHELAGIDDRVRSQLSGGFSAVIQQPDAAVRCEILRAKASAGGVGVPDECLALIVKSVAGSIRELEGALIQIVTTASLMKRPIDLELTRESLARTLPRPARPRPSPNAIIKAVANFFQTSPDVLASRSRRRDILVPRQLAMYFSHRYTDASLSQIGHELGRDHPAVRNAITRVERAILERAPLRYQVEALSERLDQLGLGEATEPEPDEARPAKPMLVRLPSTATRTATSP
jgi:chromosomal replication initiator protein